MVRIPFLRHAHLDKKSPHYLKAAQIIAKTSPAEAAQIATEPETPTVRRRPRRHSLYKFAEPKSVSQGSLFGRSCGAQLTLPFVTDATNNVSAQSSGASAPSETAVTHEAVLRAMLDQGRTPSSPRALAIMEYETRANLSLGAHRMAFQLSQRVSLLEEHARILTAMRNQNIAVLAAHPDDLYVHSLHYCIPCLLALQRQEGPHQFPRELSQALLNYRCYFPICSVQSLPRCYPSLSPLATFL